MDNLGDIMANLSASDIEQLKGVAQSIFGGQDEAQAGPAAPAGPDAGGQQTPPPPPPAGGSGNPLENPEMLMKMGKIFQNMNVEDERSKLIYALKPHLSPERQAKADEAVKMLKMFSMLPALTQSGMLGDLFGGLL